MEIELIPQSIRIEEQGDKTLKPRLLMVGLSASSRGGVESYIMNLLRAWNGLFDIYVPLHRGKVVYREELEGLGVQFFEAPVNRHHFIDYITTWKRIFDEKRFDVLYYNNCDIVSTSLLQLARKAGIKVRVFHAHSSGNQSTILSRQKLLHRLEEKSSRRKLGRNATHLFACSAVAGEYMFDGRAYQIIKNGILLPTYAYSQAKRGIIREEYHVGNDKLVVIIGRLSPQKNPFKTCEILEVFLKDTSDAQAFFIGEGEQRKETELLVHRMGLEKRIHFIGAVSNVNEWMSAGDCLLMPSLFEGLPFVLIEAQAAGLPCVVSSNVSNEANISGELRCVSLEDSVECWSDTITQAIASGRYDSKEKLIAAGYSIEDSAAQVEQIIYNALNDK